MTDVIFGGKERMVPSQLHDLMVYMGERCHVNGLNTDVGGNISYRIDNEVFITRTGCRLDQLRHGDILILSLNSGQVIHGSALPSREAEMHVMSYRACKHINCLLHLHPPYSIAMAGIPRTRLAQGTNIRDKVVPFSAAGSPKLADDTCDAFKQGANVVVQTRHGITVGAANLTDAYDLAELYEHCCKVSYLLRSI